MRANDRVHRSEHLVYVGPILCLSADRSSPGVPIHRTLPANRQGIAVASLATPLTLVCDAVFGWWANLKLKGDGWTVQSVPGVGAVPVP